MNSWCRNLELLIKSRNSLIWIRTKEEERLEKLVNLSCERINIKRFVSWDCVSGIKGLINEEGKFSNNPLGVLNWLKELNSEVSTVLLVKDFHKFYDDPSINRTIKELSSALKKSSHNLIISSHLFPSSEELDELMAIINLPLPDQRELKNLIKQIAINTNSNLEEQDLNELSIASSGLTEMKVKQVTAKALAQRGKISKEDIKDILEEKKQVIARSEILEFFEAKSSQDDIGGLNILKVWLNQRYRAFSKEARDYGLPIPKGVLLVGAQGTGKSLKMDDYVIGGKTGTSRTYLEGIGYSNDRFTTSFTGFIETSNGPIVGSVILWGAKGSPISEYVTGGSTAAPIFKTIVSNLLPSD